MTINIRDFIDVVTSGLYQNHIIRVNNTFTIWLMFITFFKFEESIKAFERAAEHRPTDVKLQIKID